MQVEVATCKLKGSEAKSYVKFPKPLNVWWRSLHWFNYMIGGATFLIGSYQYYPEVNRPFEGGFYFCLGGVTFLWADIMEWYYCYNNQTLNSAMRFYQLLISSFNTGTTITASDACLMI